MRKIAAVLLIGAIVWNGFKYWPRWDDTPPKPVSISSLMQDTAKFRGQRVRVGGRATGRLKVMGFTAFVMEDDHGQTLNVAGFTTPPEIGDLINVTGDLRWLNFGGSFKVPVLYVSS